jgi:hypothetical protein
VGIDLAKQVAARHGHLSGNAYKVPMYMALVALDKPNTNGQAPGLYFAGWEPLALALGFELPTNGDDERRRDLYEVVARAVRTLKREGLIKPLVDHPRTRHRQCFELNLSPAETTTLSPDETAGHQPR